MLRICAAFVLVCLPFSALAGVPELTGVVSVIDADTWDVGGERVRLFGIDAPELSQTCTRGQGQIWQCGAWAADQVRDRFQGREIDCERLDTDRYGRTVARCYFNGRDVSGDLVADGLAFAYRRYSTDYVADEKAAVANGLGLHASQVQAPAAFRAARLSSRNSSRAGACRIKGNISSKGVRIYHLPAQRFYRATRINEAGGERWFCSEAKARQAGWRRSKF